MAAQCYKYCLLGSDCSDPMGQTIAIPITVYESDQDDGYPSIYDTLMPNIYNTFNPPTSQSWYLISTTDPNFPYTNFVARAIEGGACDDPALDLCNVTIGDPVLDPNTISVLATLPEGSLCPTADCNTLVNCNKPSETIVANNVSVYQGVVVALQQYPEKFWSVGEPIICLNGSQSVTVVETFATCADTVVLQPAKYTRIEPKPDRTFSGITVSEQDIRDNVKFANAYYDLFRSLKYGINNFCDNLTLEKTWMRKELSDLDMIYNESECIITTPVTPIVCPEPE